MDQPSMHFVKRTTFDVSIFYVAGVALPVAVPTLLLWRRSITSSASNAKRMAVIVCLELPIIITSMKIVFTVLSTTQNTTRRDVRSVKKLFWLSLWRSGGVITGILSVTDWIGCRRARRFFGPKCCVCLFTPTLTSTPLPIPE